MRCLACAAILPRRQGPNLHSPNLRMSSRRLLKAAQAIRESVSRSILFDMKDPRVKSVTVTLVEVAPDMRTAKVYVSVMGDEKQQSLTLRGLQNAAGFLQSKLGDHIETRYTPRLTFVLDLGVKQSIEISRILQEVLPKATDADVEPATTGADEATAEFEDQADIDDGAEVERPKPDNPED